MRLQTQPERKRKKENPFEPSAKTETRSSEAHFNLGRKGLFSFPPIVINLAFLFNTRDMFFPWRDQRVIIRHTVDTVYE